MNIREEFSRIEEVPQFMETWNLLNDNLVITEKRTKEITNGGIFEGKKSISGLKARKSQEFKEEETFPLKFPSELRINSKIS